MSGLFFIGLRFFYPGLESLPEFEVFRGFRIMVQVFGFFLVVYNMHRFSLLDRHIPGRIGVVLGKLKLHNFFMARPFRRKPPA